MSGLYDSELVTWSSTFACGIKIIDDQHKRLFEITNDLFNHCKGNKTAEAAYFKKVIGAIVEHVKTHFSTEEKIMKITKFIGLYDHKKEHEAFILNVVDIITEFNRTGVINVPEVTRYLKDWVLQHIAITDRMYFDWFKKLATKKANGRFSIDEIDVMRVTQDFT